MSQNKKKHMRSVIWWVSLIMCFVFIIGGGSCFVCYYVTSLESKEVYDELASIRNSVLDDETYPWNEIIIETEPPETTEPGSDVVIVGPSLVEKEFLPECKALYELNNDMVGWISVPETDINYPVLQTGTDTRDYYLRKDFYGNYSRHGCIYASEDCNIFAPSDNITLYGHHMRDGSMFADLDLYKDYDYWKEHQYFTFDTLYEHHRYQIIAVFKTHASTGFRYHLFTNAADETDFNNFISTIKGMQFYETGLSAEYGDKIVCLSTCEYTLGDGRFVVVGKRIS